MTMMIVHCCSPFLKLFLAFWKGFVCDVITTETQSSYVGSSHVRFMGPTWDPSGADRTQVGPCWPHELCHLGRYSYFQSRMFFHQAFTTLCEIQFLDFGYHLTDISSLPTFSSFVKLDSKWGSPKLTPSAVIARLFKALRLWYHFYCNVV